MSFFAICWESIRIIWTRDAGAGCVASGAIQLECALDGKANYIVSGDGHLLTLKTFNDVVILKPADFLIRAIERVE